MSFGGFSFGANTTTTTGTTPAAGGFSFAASTSAPATTSAGGFSFSTPLGGMASSTGSSGFSLPKPAGIAPLSGFSLAGPATTAATGTASGFSLTSTSTGPTSGFSLTGLTHAKTTSSEVTFGGLGAGTASTGMGTTSMFGGQGASTAGTGMGTTSMFGGLGAGTASTGMGTTSAATPSFGFTNPLATTAASTSSGFGLGGGLSLGTSATTTTSSAFGAGLSGFGVTGSTAGGSIFGGAVAKTTSAGLGGVDPKTSTSNAASDPSKAGDGKTVKEMQVETNILLDVDELRKFVKEELTEMEQMKRLSVTPMMKVQEDNTALRQLLSLVSSGLQRNTCAVDNLKKDMTQELKNAEMAVRTKETPPGLQYENTAPTVYFQSLIEHFESQMLQYRQQIEMLESHLASVHQPNRLTNEELILLLRRLHEAFIAMAAQLHQVHEAVKTQKEHYLNYRKVFQGDTRNIFERQKKAPVRVSAPSYAEMYGQPPFPGVNNATAVAMATALNRAQQPNPQTGAPPVTGFSSFGSTTGLGSTSSTGFGFGTSSTQSAGFKGFGTGGGLFGGNSSNLATTQSGSLFSSPLPGTVGQTTLGGDQSFQLSKPPAGAKRNKR
ncbi:nucleoporin p58/p45-like [Dreissena polymorpha]|uniref:Nucleoporin p58/p45 n=1 Tax=Dreissena polymorpha TaxID=45954 RepID=A0A9D4QKC5_DREPO|nr:nucleoporin p58/p45-like [Dreissena polymorpha]KAH3833462.1 hypothetical protein DPMN_106772 [Dreissena polymorpha]